MKTETGIYDLLFKIYCDDEQHKAFLIDGAWGCGKTYQIHKFLKFVSRKKDKNKYTNENGKEKTKKAFDPQIEKSIKEYKKIRKNKKLKKLFVSYVSLFGAKDVEEIQKIVSKETKSKFKKVLNATGKVAHGVLSSISRFGTASNAVDAIANTFKKDDPKVVKKRPKKRALIIFDDLERVNFKSFNLIEFMGYIDSLVSAGIKVFCVCYENNIPKNIQGSDGNYTNNNNNYDEFKNKTFDFVDSIDRTSFQAVKEIVDSYQINDSQANEILSLVSCNLRMIEKAKEILDQLFEVLQNGNQATSEKLRKKYSDCVLIKSCIYTIMFVFGNCPQTNIDDLIKNNSQEGNRVKKLLDEYKFLGFDETTKFRLQRYLAYLHTTYKTMTNNEGNLFIAILYFYKNNQDISKVNGLIK